MVSLSNHNVSRPLRALRRAQDDEALLFLSNYAVVMVSLSNHIA
jgi:hypothetical protein